MTIPYSSFQGENKRDNHFFLFFSICLLSGHKLPHYSLFGDACNVASRMETNSRPNEVHVSPSTAAHLAAHPELFVLHARGPIQVKGKGEMSTFFITRRSKEERDAMVAAKRSSGAAPGYGSGTAADAAAHFKRIRSSV
jgi:hypothetical protein